MPKAKSRTQLKKILDREFSRFIRTRNIDEYGYDYCYTCGDRKHWKEVDAGHFVTRAAMSTRWLETNVQFQCKKCNGFRGGESYLFGLQLDRDYGPGTADGIIIRSKQIYKHTLQELRDLIQDYKNKTSHVESSR